jgi:hypothetical protein
MPSSAARKFLARDLTIEVNTGSVAVPVWTPVGGLTSLTHSPSTERADAGGFDTGGRAAHMVVERGDSWTIEGHAKVDPADGALDAGQAAIEASAEAVGLAAELMYRLTIPGTGAPVRTFTATAEVTLPGGGKNDLAAWGAALEVTGVIAKS